MNDDGRFVGVAIDQYDEPHLALDYPANEIRVVTERLQSHLSGVTLINLSANQIRDELAALSNSPANRLVLLWSGHGTVKGDSLWLRGATGELIVTDVVTKCVESGASQILMMFDCCHAGQGTVDAHRAASALLAQFPPAAERVWVGVLVSCRAGESARDGAFGSSLQRLLAEGPKSPELRRRWSRHNRMIFGDDLGAALVEDWEDPEQTPGFVTDGRRWFMIPNPLWDPDAPDEVVEHLLLAARGGAGANGESWFSGRTNEIDRIVDWLHQCSTGLRVVVGPPGSGKSALLGRVVSLSNPQERNLLLSSGIGLPHSDPGLLSVHAHILARGLTADQMAELIDAQLSREPTSSEGHESVVLDRLQSGLRNGAELLGALQRASERGAAPPVIVVDGLDEAGDAAFAIAENLLTGLSRFATVIVSTRRMVSRNAGYSLLDVLSPIDMLDLNAPEQRASQRDAITEYVHKRLGTHSDVMDPSEIAEELAKRSHDRDSFLSARVVVDQLAKAPIDTSLRNWQQYLLQSINQAYETDLARVKNVGGPVEAADRSVVAQALLLALTQALGAGFPEDDWLRVGSAIARKHLSIRDINWVCDALGRYIVQDGESGVAVYRIAHESLADYLKPSYVNSFDAADSISTSVWRALFERYRDFMQDGRDPEELTYFWRYGHRHAAAAGALALDDLRETVALVPALNLILARADLEFAMLRESDGDTEAALSLTEEAAALFEAAHQDPRGLAHTADLAQAKGLLGVRRRAVGDVVRSLGPAAESEGLYRALSETNLTYLSSLAAALGNLGLSHLDLQQFEEALAALEESVALYTQLAMSSRSDELLLARSLENLGVCYREFGRHDDALQSVDRALALYRSLEASDASLQSAVAKALGNRAISLRDLGREDESMTVVEDVVETYRGLDSQQSEQRSGLATALGNLGIGYLQSDRPGDAVAACSEAADLFRELAATNATYQQSLASTLVNLAQSLRSAGRTEDATSTVEEALSVHQQVAERTGANKELLAGSAKLLTQMYIESGSPERALGPAELTVACYAELSASTTNHTIAYALALTTLGNVYRGLARPQDAVAVVEKASLILRASPPDVAATALLTWVLTVFTNCLREIGRPQDALPIAEEAAHLLRQLNSQGGEFAESLAGCLIDLGNIYKALDRQNDALNVTEEAATLLNELATVDARHRRGWAVAAGNVSLIHLDAGRLPEALLWNERATAALRSLTHDSDRASLELARALMNSVGIYSELERYEEALTAVEEAVRLYEQSASAPFHLFEIGGALCNFSSSLRMVGQIYEAVDPAERGVSIFQQLANDNAARIPDLATALANLEALMIEIGDLDRAEYCWTQAISGLANDELRASLQLQRASHVPPGDVLVVGWLVEAMTCAHDDPSLEVSVRAMCRHHRATDPDGWDSHWQIVSGQPPPLWMLADAELIENARIWAQMPDPSDFENPSTQIKVERDFLKLHSELLDQPAGESALGEALMELTGPSGSRKRRLISEAMSVGVDAAYQPLILLLEFEAFTSSGAAGQRATLQNRRSDLLDRQALKQILEAGLTTPQQVRSHALLTFASHASVEDVDRVLDALDEPDRIPSLLKRIAALPNAIELLPMAGAVVRASSDSVEILCAADIFAAVAAALIDDAQQVDQLSGSAVRLAPQSRDRWIAEIVELAATVPKSLQVITALVSRQP